VEEAIERRRSRRDFADRPLPLEELSRLLHLAQGITEPSYPLRAAPSAGALYPIEVYPVVNGVSQLAQGVYHYSVQHHALDLIREGDYRLALTAFALGQEMAGQAAVTFVLTALWQRLRWKYRERSYRYALLEAGHIAQNLYLGATSRGQNCVAIGAFLDDDINRLVGVDGEEESALYLVAVGPRPG
jgi:SagB-type dehydrogenase family enzyme